MKQSDPLQGITLETLLITLEDNMGWEELGTRINIRCFTHDPSIKSSLKFLRKTPWARAKVEEIYIKMVRNNQISVADKKPFKTVNKPDKISKKPVEISQPIDTSVAKEPTAVIKPAPELKEAEQPAKRTNNSFKF